VVNKQSPFPPATPPRTFPFMTTALDRNQILSEIAAGYFPLSVIADRHGLEFEDFLEWLDTPDVALSLERLERAMLRRAAIVAAERRASALSTLDEILRPCEFDERNMPPARDVASPSGRHPPRENARRPCTTIIRSDHPPIAPNSPPPGDVLLAGTGGLDHLVDGAVAPGKEALAEAEGDVVDGLGLLVGEKVAKLP
jgi:hypothetical protein